jgi:adenylate cyclase 9
LDFDFVCKIGVNIGPVTAGVIGTTKLYYDIWGDTVNIASRMYSTGVEDRIQVSEETRRLLIDRYDFQYRDKIDVKGVDGMNRIITHLNTNLGGMNTFLLVGRKGEPPLNGPNAVKSLL